MQIKFRILTVLVTIIACLCLLTSCSDKDRKEESTTGRDKETNPPQQQQSYIEPDPIIQDNPTSPSENITDVPDEPPTDKESSTLFEWPTKTYSDILEETYPDANLIQLPKSNMRQFPLSVTRKRQQSVKVLPV